MQDKIAAALQKTTDTRFLLLEECAVRKAGDLFRKCFSSSKAVIVADSNTWEVAGKAVAESLGRYGVTQERPFVFTDSDLYAEWSFVESLQACLESTDAVAVAVGSGVINDLCKYVSGRLGRKYMCVGTAASMDGFTAYGASITRDGNKQTFSCPAPCAFLMDPEIPAKAPMGMSASGYADLIAKVPAGADWIAIGPKPQFPNFDLYSVDMSERPFRAVLPYPGYSREKIKCLKLSDDGITDPGTGISGWRFKWGSTGICALGDGLFYISENGKDERGQYSTIRLYVWTGDPASPFSGYTCEGSAPPKGGN